MFIRLVAALTVGLSALVVTGASSNELIAPNQDDPHYSPLGYWDIHVCNWPDRPPFYLTILKTEEYEQIEKIEVFAPNGKSAGSFEMQKFRDFDREGKTPLRVLLTHLPLLPEKPEGWFTAHITAKDGRRFMVKDYLIMKLMDRADGHVPAHSSEVVEPWELSWSPVEGAKHYRVWIRDLWNDGKQIYRSGLLNESRLELPEGLIQPDGWYSWRIHTRDTFGHVLLGEFNHGSLTEWVEFSTLEE